MSPGDVGPGQRAPLRDVELNRLLDQLGRLVDELAEELRIVQSPKRGKHFVRAGEVQAGACHRGAEIGERRDLRLHHRRDFRINDDRPAQVGRYRDPQAVEPGGKRGSGEHRSRFRQR